MPKKIANANAWPTLVLERLLIWGKCIQTQRLQQRIKAEDLCARLGVSRATLRRLENGDPGAGVGAYLTALMILGMADQLTPSVSPDLWQGVSGTRVRLSRLERGEDDEDYF